MQYRTFIPRPPLSQFIERFWACSDVPAHARERILPSGTFEIVVNLVSDEIRVFDSRYSGAVVSGAYERFFVIDPLQHASIIGVHFRPGGAWPFLNVPPDEVGGAHLDLETCWGNSARSLRDRLCSARTAEERFAILEDVLLQQLRPRPLHPAVATALAAFGGSGTRVRDVVRDVGLSHRRFLQLFTREVGMTPKVYERVQRFQRARTVAEGDWAEVAFACGYFDQAHLHRDFQAFSGFSPGAYQRQRSERVLPNHVPVNFFQDPGPAAP